MRLWSRRRVLQTGLAGAGAAAWPWTELFAQGSGVLLRAPKQALVIGNSKYKHAPLKNPVNDASGMGAALKGAGFTVTVGLELTQAAMAEAIRAYSENLGKTKAVGLFYFAGHGAQLAWRNYLLPVDADIVNVEELKERAVDVNSLIEGIRKAGNPMNMIVLDACRDNPFGGSARLDQKGLSQLDAPPGTLLAYATAPGNTAIDGEGTNGLYTEHLLREIKVPEAKVEDVFKRVRLAVRRRSNGLQIPWESTSLEEDFWFVPPKELKKLAEEEIEKEFKQELALWERIQNATQPQPLEEYLRSYPSGRFSELAQLRLDRMLAKLGEKKIEVVAAAGNPYSKGTVAANTAYKLGDSYSYRRLNLLTKLAEGEFTERVTEITETEVIYNKGRFVTDLLGNTLKMRNGAVWSPNQTAPTDFSVGKRWKTQFHWTKEESGDGAVDLELRIVDREQVTVAAGTFNAFRVEANGWLRRASNTVHWDWKTWYAPDQVRRPVAYEWFNRRAGRKGGITQSSRFELTAFKQS
jgi:caspase domain-containing protein